jgi:hypothetical protein
VDYDGRKPDKMEKQQREEAKTLNALFTFLSVYVSYICLNARISFGLFPYEEKFPCDTLEYEWGEEEFLST